MRAVVYIGDMRICALVDSGSDYDALDQDLAELQAKRQNPAFRSRSRVATQNVSGFSSALRQTTENESEWELRLCGSATFGGTNVERRVNVRFNEFRELSDPMILGMPFIDLHGGLEVTSQFLWVGGLWLPRWQPSEPGTPCVLHDAG